MNATEALIAFVTRVLVPEKATRIADLAATKKGQRKILDGFCHEFEPSVRKSAACNRDYSNVWEQPCFAFHSQVGFGTEFQTVREAYDKLLLTDGWLIVLKDASAGIHRREARWDDEKLISG